MDNALTAAATSDETAARINDLRNGRRLADHSVGEWDHIISLVDKHIEASEQCHRDGTRNGYAYGPSTRAKFYGYRTRAARKMAKAVA